MDDVVPVGFGESGSASFTVGRWLAQSWALGYEPDLLTGGEQQGMDRATGFHVRASCLSSVATDRSPNLSEPHLSKWNKISRN